MTRTHNALHLVLQGYISLWGSSRCTNEIAFSYSKTLLQRYHPEVLEGHLFGVQPCCGSHAVDFFHVLADVFNFAICSFSAS